MKKRAVITVIYMRLAIVPVYPQSIIETLRSKKERQTKLKDKIKAPTTSIKADDKH